MNNVSLPGGTSSRVEDDELLVQLNLSDKSGKKIVLNVFASDDPLVTAESFSREHNFPEEVIPKLAERIQEQIDTAILENAISALADDNVAPIESLATFGSSKGTGGDIKDISRNHGISKSPQVGASNPEGGDLCDSSVAVSYLGYDAEHAPHGTAHENPAFDDETLSSESLREDKKRNTARKLFQNENSSPPSGESIKSYFDNNAIISPIVSLGKDLLPPSSSRGLVKGAVMAMESKRNVQQHLQIDTSPSQRGNSRERDDKTGVGLQQQMNEKKEQEEKEEREREAAYERAKWNANPANKNKINESPYHDFGTGFNIHDSEGFFDSEPNSPRSVHSSTPTPAAATGLANLRVSRELATHSGARLQRRRAFSASAAVDRNRSGLQVTDFSMTNDDSALGGWARDGMGETKDPFTRNYEQAERYRMRRETLKKQIERERFDQINRTTFRESIGHLPSVLSMTTDSRHSLSHRRRHTLSSGYRPGDEALGLEYFEELYSSSLIWLSNRDKKVERLSQRLTKEKEDAITKELTLRPNISTSPHMKLKISQTEEEKQEVYDALYQSHELYSAHKQQLRAERDEIMRKEEKLLFQPLITPRSRKLAQIRLEKRAVEEVLALNTPNHASLMSQYSSNSGAEAGRSRSKSPNANYMRDNYIRNRRGDSPSATTLTRTNQTQTNGMFCGDQQENGRPGIGTFSFTSSQEGEGQRRRGNILHSTAGSSSPCQQRKSTPKMRQIGESIPEFSASPRKCEQSKPSSKQHAKNNNNSNNNSNNSSDSKRSRASSPYVFDDILNLQKDDTEPPPASSLPFSPSPSPLSALSPPTHVSGPTEKLTERMTKTPKREIKGAIVGREDKGGEAQYGVGIADLDRSDSVENKPKSCKPDPSKSPVHPLSAAAEDVPKMKKNGQELDNLSVSSSAASSSLTQRSHKSSVSMASENLTRALTPTRERYGKSAEQAAQEVALEQETRSRSSALAGRDEGASGSKISDVAAEGYELIPIDSPPMDSEHDNGGKGVERVGNNGGGGGGSGGAVGAYDDNDDLSFDLSQVSTLTPLTLPHDPHAHERDAVPGRAVSPLQSPVLHYLPKSGIAHPRAPFFGGKDQKSMPHVDGLSGEERRGRGRERSEKHFARPTASSAGRSRSKSREIVVVSGKNETDIGAKPWKPDYRSLRAQEQLELQQKTLNDTTSSWYKARSKSPVSGHISHSFSAKPMPKNDGNLQDTQDRTRSRPRTRTRSVGDAKSVGSGVSGSGRSFISALSQSRFSRHDSAAILGNSAKNLLGIEQRRGYGLGIVMQQRQKQQQQHQQQQQYGSIVTSEVGTLAYSNSTDSAVSPSAPSATKTKTTTTTTTTADSGERGGGKRRNGTPVKGNNSRNVGGRSIPTEITGSRTATSSQESTGKSRAVSSSIASQNRDISYEPVPQVDVTNPDSVAEAARSLMKRSSLFDRLYEARKEVAQEQQRVKDEYYSTYCPHTPDIGVNKLYGVESEKEQFFDRLHKEEHFLAKRQEPKMQTLREFQAAKIKSRPMTPNQKEAMVDRLLEKQRTIEERLQKEKNEFQQKLDKNMYNFAEFLPKKSRSIATQAQSQALSEIFDVLLLSAEMKADLMHAPSPSSPPPPPPPLPGATILPSPVNNNSIAAADTNQRTDALDDDHSAHISSENAAKSGFFNGRFSPKGRTSGTMTLDHFQASSAFLTQGFNADSSKSDSDSSESETDAENDTKTRDLFAPFFASTESRQQPAPAEVMKEGEKEMRGVAAALDERARKEGPLEGEENLGQESTNARHNRVNPSTTVIRVRGNISEKRGARDQISSSLSTETPTIGPEISSSPVGQGPRNRFDGSLSHSGSFFDGQSSIGHTKSGNCSPQPHNQPPAGRNELSGMTQLSSLSNPFGSAFGKDSYLDLKLAQPHLLQPPLLVHAVSSVLQNIGKNMHKSTAVESEKVPKIAPVTDDKAAPSLVSSDGDFAQNMSETGDAPMLLSREEFVDAVLSFMQSGKMEPIGHLLVPTQKELGKKTRILQSHNRAGAGELGSSCSSLMPSGDRSVASRSSSRGRSSRVGEGQREAQKLKEGEAEGERQRGRIDNVSNDKARRDLLMDDSADDFHGGVVYIDVGRESKRGSGLEEIDVKSIRSNISALTTTTVGLSSGNNRLKSQKSFPKSSTFGDHAQQPLSVSEPDSSRLDGTSENESKRSSSVREREGVSGRWSVDAISVLAGNTVSVEEVFARPYLRQKGDNRDLDDSTTVLSAGQGQFRRKKEGGNRGERGGKGVKLCYSAGGRAYSAAQRGTAARLHDGAWDPAKEPVGENQVREVLLRREGDYLARVQHLDSTEREVALHCTWQPELVHTSAVNEELVRERYALRRDKRQTVEDSLLEYAEYKEKRRQELIAQKEEEINKICTFVPETRPPFEINRSRSRSRSGSRTSRSKNPDLSLKSTDLGDSAGFFASRAGNASRAPASADDRSVGEHRSVSSSRKEDRQRYRISATGELLSLDAAHNSALGPPVLRGRGRNRSSGSSSSGVESVSIGEPEGKGLDDDYNDTSYTLRTPTDVRGNSRERGKGGGGGGRLGGYSNTGYSQRNPVSCSLNRRAISPSTRSRIDRVLDGGSTAAAGHSKEGEMVCSNRVKEREKERERERDGEMREALYISESSSLASSYRSSGGTRNLHENGSAGSGIISDESTQRGEGAGGGRMSGDPLGEGRGREGGKGQISERQYQAEQDRRRSSCAPSRDRVRELARERLREMEKLESMKNREHHGLLA